MFNKPFVAIENRARGITRFQSLVNVLQAEDRLVMDAAEITGNKRFLEPVDYEKVNRLLAQEREKSLNWLKEKLFAPKVIHSNCAYPVVDERLQQ